MGRNEGIYQTIICFLSLGSILTRKYQLHGTPNINILTLSAIANLKIESIIRLMSLELMRAIENCFHA